MLFLRRLKKKHYIQFGLAVLLTGIFLYLTSFLWLCKEIIVSFDAESVNDIEYQSFYTEEKGQKFNRDQSVKKYVKKGSSKVVIALPIEKIVMFRLDVGSYPDKVLLSNLKIAGNHILPLKLNNFKYSKDINTHKIEQNLLILTSSKNDPYIIYQPELNLPAGTSVDLYMLVILATLSFLSFNKLVRYLSKFKLEGKYSRIDIVMLALFFGLLFIPMSYISNAEKSEQENRMLAKKPHWTTQGGYSSYGPQFDAWYSDHFFGRKLLIYIHDFLRFLINTNGTGHNALIGKDGWLWGTGFNEIKMFQNANLFTPEELQQIGEHIENFVKNAKGSGVKEVYFILSNDKESMYPEFYPTYIKKENDQSRLEQVVEYMHKNYPQIKLYNFKKELDELKAKEIIFYKAGTHLNHIGAFAEYSLLMQEIKKDFPELKILQLSDFKVQVSNEKKGDIALFNHFSLLPFYSQDNFKNKYLTPKYKQPAELKNNGKKGFLNILVWNNKEANNDYKVLAISDSFLAQYLRYLAVSFNQTFHLFFGGGIDFGKEDIRNYLLSNRPDIIIVGSTERFLHRFLKLEFPKNSQKED